MRKIIILVLLIVASCSAIFYILKDELNITSIFDNQQEKENFNIIFRYGVNELDTFNEIFIKDMIVDDPLVITLKLSESDLRQIDHKIDELQLFDGESSIEKGPPLPQTPCSNFYLKVKRDAIENELSWDDCKGLPTKKLNQFSTFMYELIGRQDNYKKLPEPKGGYL